MNSASMKVMMTFPLGWSDRFTARLGAEVTGRLWLLGNRDLIQKKLTALFCSARCPGNEILKAQDKAHALRNQEPAVISGFHSPVEKECLRILLRGTCPLIWCPARSLDRMRIPKDLKPALDSGRLLILSLFEKYPHRATAESACRRNDLVAALADKAIIIYAEPGGEVERIKNLLAQWRVPF
jgi:predicted Rossmann fold nucleotide-binding protein DprA/Smf involved in DNA uptake